MESKSISRNQDIWGQKWISQQLQFCATTRTTATRNTTQSWPIPELVRLLGQLRIHNLIGCKSPTSTGLSWTKRLKRPSWTVSQPQLHPIHDTLITCFNRRHIPDAHSQHWVCEPSFTTNPMRQQAHLPRISNISEIPLCRSVS